MFDSLAYRNDAATVFRRLFRSLPSRRGVLGVASCDKGLRAMMKTRIFDARMLIAQRQKKILRMLPYTMDLLTLSVEAGLDFVSGIAKVVEKSKPGPLVEELGRQALLHVARGAWASVR